MRGSSARVTALVALAALVLGVIGAKLLWRESAPPAGVARLMLDFPVTQQPRVTTGPGTILAQLPDGSGLLYSGPGANTRTQFWLRRWDQLGATRLPQTPDEGCCIVFSPSGDSLAYLTGPHRLHVLPLGGGLPTIVADSGLTSVTDWGGGVDWGPDGQLYVSGTEGIVRLSPGGGPIEAVTRLDAERGDLRHLWPAVLPSAKAALVTIVPTRESNNPERWSIGVAEFSTGKITTLLQGVRAIYAPTGHILLAKANGVLWATPFDAKTLQLTGRERELADTVALTAGNADLSLSPGGTLAYTKGVVQSFQPMWVDRAGNATIISPDLSDFAVATPALSPDGRKLLLSMSGTDAKYHMWVKTLGGGPKSRLTFDGTVNDRGTWRPGTNSFTFNSDLEEPGIRYQLFESNADGSARLQKVDRRDPRGSGGHTWAPDGKWLVFRTDDQAAGNADIMAIRPGIDTVARALVATEAEELDPAISPDGRWMAYSSNVSGRREIYVRPFPDTDLAQYQVSTTGGTNPAWNRDGRELFYLDAGSKMIATPVSTGATFQSGAPQVLFPASQYWSNPFFRQYDVTADGQRFVMIRGESDAAVHVVVVFNFLEELTRVMAAP